MGVDPEKVKNRRKDDLKRLFKSEAMAIGLDNISTGKTTRSAFANISDIRKYLSTLFIYPDLRASLGVLPVHRLKAREKAL